MKHLLNIVCILAASTGVVFAEVAEPKGRPNFLIIMVDDLSPEQFGCYDNEVNHTPNLDALAAGGVKFNTAWATPMCSPTRALMVTGRYASRTGVWHNDLRLNCTKQTRWNWVSKHLTFPRVLREHGYRTAIVGNPMALGGSIYSKDVGFDEQCVRALTLQDVPEGSTFTGKFEGKYNFPDAKPVPARYWHPCVIRNGELMKTTAEDFGPDLYAGFLIDFIKRHEDQPFLAYYPMNLVHDMAGGGIPTTPVDGIPGSNKGGSLQGLVEYIDILVGRLMEGLETAGLRENTIVIFTCDNGENGKKMHASEDGSRVPFIVNCPGLIQQRGATDELMEFSDIYPTLMEFSGASVPDGYALDGQSLVPFLTGATDIHREWITSYIATARMVRTKRWLLEAVDPVYGDSEGRLFDCGDAHLRSNYKDITGSPEALPIRKKLEELLENNPWPDLSDPDVAAEVDSYDTMPYKHFVNGQLVKEQNYRK